MATKKKRDERADKRDTAATPRGKRSPGAIQKELLCKISDEDRKKYGDALAASKLEVNRLREEKSAYLTAQGAKIKEAEERCTKLATAIDNGEELRLVDCYWHEELSKHEKYLERGDTHEEIERRSMSHEELQTEFG